MKNDKIYTGLKVADYKRELTSRGNKENLDQMFKDLLELGMFDIEADGTISMAVLNHENLSKMNEKAKIILGEDE